MITIFTPSYNRAYKLKDLFLSLIKQTNHDFEWLIIDDGSIDDTRDLVESFTTDLFPIRYIYKKNEGKQIAINKAAIEANGEWIFIVDSDDILTPDAIETVQYYCSNLPTDKKFAGVVGLRGNQKGEIWETSRIDIDRKTLGNILRMEYIDATQIDYRYTYKIQGDRAEVIRTDILKRYPFPKFRDETFIPEEYLWINLASDGYLFRWFNKVIYITEYLEDGLTRNGKDLAKKNCVSKSYVDNIKTGIKKIQLKERFKCSINYFRYGIYGGKTLFTLYRESKAKCLALLSIPIALIIKVK